MSDENLTKYVKSLEAEIGKERVRLLRGEALRRGITIEAVLSEAAKAYAAAICKQNKESAA